MALDDVSFLGHMVGSIGIGLVDRKSVVRERVSV